MEVLVYPNTRLRGWVALLRMNGEEGARSSLLGDFNPARMTLLLMWGCWVRVAIFGIR